MYLYPTVIDAHCPAKCNRNKGSVNSTGRMRNLEVLSSVARVWGKCATPLAAASDLCHSAHNTVQNVP